MPFGPAPAIAVPMVTLVPAMLAATAAPAHTLTRAQDNAVRPALSYLRISGFSLEGLIDQLSSS